MKIPYGQLDGRMVGIDEVLSGLACGCVCSDCKSPLVARKGEIRAHYFAHHSRESCETAFETAIHLMSKQLIEEAKMITLPALTVSESLVTLDGTVLSDSELVTKAKNQVLTEVRLEEGIHDFRPDIIGYHKGRRLLIEIFVAHRVGSNKLKKIREKSEAALEIDLSKVNRLLSKEALYEIVVKGTEKKKWLSLPSAISAKQRVRESIEAQLQRKKELGEKEKLKRQMRRQPIIKPQKMKKTIQVVKKSEPVREGWLHCEHCKNTWSVELSIFNALGSVTECPSCTMEVSTKPSPFR